MTTYCKRSPTSPIVIACNMTGTFMTVASAGDNAVEIEFGFQYTFLRRHRLRPYLGVN